MEAASAGRPDRRVSYDLAQYPVTRAILDRSVVLFSQTYPLAPQPRRLVEAYAEAFARVWTRLPEVLARVSPEAPGLFARPWVRIACAILGTAVLAASVWGGGGRPRCWPPSGPACTPCHYSHCSRR
jgi:hypothetical protein